MTLSPELLNTARASALDLEQAERQAALARTEYHTAIRRLHLAGASLREIAQALSLSHQRVQQIVSGAGGTWWRRVWRTRNQRADLTCTWCGRPPSEVAKLIAGPNVFICDSCIKSAETAIARGSGPGPFLMRAEGRVRGRCAFCAKRESEKRLLAPSPAGPVCSECLRICREILAAS